MSKFLPFGEALAVARSLGLASVKEWRAWSKEGLRPPNVPSMPNTVYKDGGWQGWGHWLGTGNQLTKEFLPFDEALTMAQSLGLANRFEWEAWSKEGMRPHNVPGDPRKVYKDHGWQGWGHWLGTGNLATKQFLPFEEALVMARSFGLGMAGAKEWQEWSKAGMRPRNVPANPNKVYKDRGWQGWGHWLGTGNQLTKEFLPFNEALLVVRSLGLPGRMKWRVWSKEGRPLNVPSNPQTVYKDHGWQGWGHWLGTGNQSNQAKKAQFLPFGEALRVARQLRLVSVEEWRLWCRSGARPANLPATPEQAYVHDGWTGWVHWLGTGNGAGNKKKFLPFDEALRVAWQLRLVNQKEPREEWRAWCRTGARPANMPARPDKTYVHDGWVGWVHWLGQANLDAATAASSARPAGKRAAARSAETSGQSRGKRRRR